MTVKILLCLVILGGVVFSMQASAAVFHDSIITNGKFDDGVLAWTLENVDSSDLEDQYALDGQYLTLGQLNQTEAISQTLTIPAETGQAALSFYYRFYTDDATSSDDLTVEFVRAGTSTVLFTKTIPASNGDVVTWTKRTMDVSALAGETVIMRIAVTNNASQFTFVDLDTIRLTVDSYGELKATVVDASGDPVRNAEITLRNAKDKKIWTGTTNAKGKFTATTLPGNNKKYRLVIKKNDSVTTKHTKIQWAERTTKTFRIESL